MNKLDVNQTILIEGKPHVRLPVIAARVGLCEASIRRLAKRLNGKKRGRCWWFHIETVESRLETVYAKDSNDNAQGKLSGNGRESTFADISGL